MLYETTGKKGEKIFMITCDQCEEPISTDPYVEPTICYGCYHNIPYSKHEENSAYVYCYICGGKIYDYDLVYCLNCFKNLHGEV